MPYRVDMVLTPEERTAQRKLVGALNMRNAMWFEPKVGFCIWRDQRASQEWGGGIPELSAHFDTLAIPYVVRSEVLTESGSDRRLVSRSWSSGMSCRRSRGGLRRSRSSIDSARAEVKAAASDS